jgi:hypothetical protein
LIDLIVGRSRRCSGQDRITAHYCRSQYVFMLRIPIDILREGVQPRHT